MGGKSFNQRLDFFAHEIRKPVCVSLRIALPSNSLLTVGLVPKLSIRRFLTVDQLSVGPGKRVPLTIS